MATKTRTRPRRDLSDAEGALVEARTELARTQEAVTGAEDAVRRLETRLSTLRDLERRTSARNAVLGVVLVGGTIGVMAGAASLSQSLADWRSVISGSLGLAIVMGGILGTVAVAMLVAKEAARLAHPRFEGGEAVEVRRELIEARRLAKGARGEGKAAKQALDEAQRALGSEGGQLALSGEGGELAIEGAEGALSPSGD